MDKSSHNFTCMQWGLVCRSSNTELERSTTGRLLGRFAGLDWLGSSLPSPSVDRDWSSKACTPAPGTYVCKLWPPCARSSWLLLSGCERWELPAMPASAEAADRDCSSADQVEGAEAAASTPAAPGPVAVAAVAIGGSLATAGSVQEVSFVVLRL